MISLKLCSKPFIIFNDNSQFNTVGVIPNKRGVTPRYDQITLDIKDRENKFQQVLSPIADDEGVWIHQDAWFHMGNFEAGKTANYSIKKSGNGVYAFILSGAVTINGEALSNRDGMGIENAEELTILANTNAEILLMEVPMNV